ncbi:MAG: extracellular solute-binding protein [Burkholderiaceae bacterium]
MTNLPCLLERGRGPQNDVGGASLWVMAGKTDADYKGVARFLSFLSQPEVQAKWHQETGFTTMPQHHRGLRADQAAGF